MSELQKAINKLVQLEPGWKEFTKPPAKGAKPAVVGKGLPGGGTSQGGAVMLTEGDYLHREYWPASAVTRLETSDGLFSIEVEAIKKVELQAGGAINFAQPVAPP